MIHHKSQARRSRSTEFTLTILSVAGLALTGCSSTSASDAADSNSPDEVTTVRVASTTTFNQLLTDLAICADLGAANDLNIERVTTSTADSAAMIAALLAGDADFAVPGSNSVYDAVAQGADLKIVAALGPYQGGFVVSEKAYGEDNTAESTVQKRLESLKDKVVAVGPDGSTSNAIMRYMLDDAGIDADTDIKIVPLRDMSGVVAVGLQQGTYDAAFSPVGTADPAIISGDAHVLASIPAGDFPEFNDYAIAASATTAEFAAENPEVVEAFQTTMEDARTFLNDDPEQAASILKECAYSAMDQELFDVAFEQAVPAFENFQTKYTESHHETLVRLFDPTAEADYSSIDYDGLTFK